MLSASYEPNRPYADCARTEPRTNMFVMAALVTGSTREQVKVRNMSGSGAMVEGRQLPAAGATCLLHRGDISLDATVIWVGDRKAGIRFTERADVSHWLPSGRRTQAEVDTAVRMARAELVATPQAKVDAPLYSSDLAREDVVSIAAALEALADDLAEDPAVVARFMTKLQTLDISVQTLRKLASRLP